MFLPIRDDIPKLKTSCAVWVYLLVTSTILFFLSQQNSPDLRQIFSQFGFDNLERPFDFVTLFTHAFLHSDWEHLFFNAFFLVVFGRSVENKLGSLKFTLACAGLAIAGCLPHWWLYPHRIGIGASAVVCGLLGMHFVLFPRAKTTVLFCFFLFRAYPLSARLMIGLSVVLDLVLALLGYDRIHRIGYSAHVAGFVAGLCLAYLWTLDEGAKKFPPENTSTAQTDVSAAV